MLHLNFDVQKPVNEIDLSLFINRNLRNKPAIWESDEAAPEEQVQEEGEVVARHDHDLAVREMLENSCDKFQGPENLEKSEIKSARVGKVKKDLWKDLEEVHKIKKYPRTTKKVFTLFTLCSLFTLFTTFTLFTLFTLLTLFTLFKLFILLPSLTLSSLFSFFLRHPEVMQPLLRHFRGQHGLKTVFRSNFSPEMAGK